MRILIRPEWYPSASSPTAGVFIRDQARAAARLHDVTVLVHHPMPRARGEASVTTALEDGLRVVRVHTRMRLGTTRGRLEFLAIAALALRRMRRRGQGPDILHGHVFSSGFLALLLSHGRYPVVVSEHHTDFIEGKVRGRDAVVARFVFRHATLVCPVSGRLERHLEQFQPSGRYEVVPEVVDVEPFVPSAQQIARHGGPARLLVVALLSPQKGIEYLLDGWPRCTTPAATSCSTSSATAPNGRRSSSSRWCDYLRSRRFHGERSRAEVAAFMARADAFVLPSVVETFGVVLIEALAAGLPIITTRAVPDYQRFEPPFGIVVQPRDAAALRDAVLAMLERGSTGSPAAALALARSFSGPRSAVAGTRSTDRFTRESLGD